MTSSKSNYISKVLSKYYHIGLQHMNFRDTIQSMCMCASLLQSGVTLCYFMYCSPSCSAIHGILQARILERLPFPTPEALPDPEIEPTSPALLANSLLLRHLGSPENLILKSLKQRFSKRIDGLKINLVGLQSLEAKSKMLGQGVRSTFTEVKWLYWALAMHHDKEMTEILVLNKYMWKICFPQKER